jgi:HAD superfamily hydrolase (TIGR01509 family)
MKSVIKGIIFDFDGLILDTETPLRQSWFELLEKYGLEVSMTGWAAGVGDPLLLSSLEEILKTKIGQSQDWGSINHQRYQREMELLMKEDTLPGVLALIQEAKAMGIRLGVASSSDTEWVTSHLTRLGLMDEFDSIRCADEESQKKPAPALYLAVLDDLELSAKEAIAFEDASPGIRAAKTAGIFCVAVPNSVTKHGSIHAADIIVESIEDLTLEEYLKAAAQEHR